MAGIIPGGVGFLEILSPKPPGVSGAVSKASRSAGACNGSRNLGNYPFLPLKLKTVVWFQNGVDPTN